MSIVKSFGFAGGRLTRRGLLGGMVLGSAAALVACSGGASAPAASAPPAGAASSAATVKMTDTNLFDPATVTITKGGTVTWTNSSSMVHSVTDDPAKAANKADAVLPAGAAAWDSGLLNAAATFTHKFDVAGTYKYFCIPHESLGMLGTIIVQ